LGIIVLLVEQEVSTVFKMTSRNDALSSGKIIAEGAGEQLLLWGFSEFADWRDIDRRKVSVSFLENSWPDE
jgi:hypothetical protein